MLKTMGKKRNSRPDSLIYKNNFTSSKRSQLTLFIILAIIIVVGIGLVLTLRGKITIEKLPARFKPVAEYFSSCVEENAGIGAEILGERAGYIYTPDFIPGSEYMPTSNHLDFLGSPIPYWYYVSGNNIIREQVPSKQEMEKQLEEFIEERIMLCDFSEFERRGFFVGIEKTKASVEIKENKVEVALDTVFTISDGEETAQLKKLDVAINTKLGKFYDLAREVYEKEKKEMFLENYGVDILRLYAPVDGVELTCSPEIWSKQEIDSDLKQAITVNTEQLRVKGDSYNLKDKTKKYFVIKMATEEAINFLYSQNWPTKIEVEPQESGMLIAEPVGLQPGLGALGFCYVPYHFVYDLVYPVLIQIYDNKEMFQFPVSVIIEGNKPRDALPGTSLGEQEVELCKYKNQDVIVYTYNNNLEPTEAKISFKCFQQSCDIGNTIIEGGDAVLKEKFPRCVNGFILAKAEGYEIVKYQISTNVETVANILLDRLYEQDLTVRLDGKETEQQAIIYFESEEAEKSKTVVWPQMDSFELSEGFYNVSVFVYSNSSIKIPASSTEKCVDVPKSGLLGVFGAKEERCFDIDFPEQTLSAGIIGGGRGVYYTIEDELKKGKLEVNVEKFPTPTSLEQLQDNYNLLEVKSIGLRFG